MQARALVVLASNMIKIHAVLKLIEMGIPLERSSPGTDESVVRQSTFGIQFADV
jgi:hypothetical protein